MQSHAGAPSNSVRSDAVVGLLLRAGCRVRVAGLQGVGGCFRVLGVWGTDSNIGGESNELTDVTSGQALLDPFTTWSQVHRVWGFVSAVQTRDSGHCCVLLDTQQTAYRLPSVMCSSALGVGAWMPLLELGLYAEQFLFHEVSKFMRILPQQQGQ